MGRALGASVLSADNGSHGQVFQAGRIARRPSITCQRDPPYRNTVTIACTLRPRNAEEAV